MYTLLDPIQCIFIGTNFFFHCCYCTCTLCTNWSLDVSILRFAIEMWSRQKSLRYSKITRCKMETKCNWATMAIKFLVSIWITNEMRVWWNVHTVSLSFVFSIIFLCYSRFLWLCFLLLHTFWTFLYSFGCLYYCIGICVYIHNPYSISLNLSARIGPLLVLFTINFFFLRLEIEYSFGWRYTCTEFQVPFGV